MNFVETVVTRKNSYERPTWSGVPCVEPKKLIFSFSVLTSSGNEDIELTITKNDILWLMDDAQ